MGEVLSVNSFDHLGVEEGKVYIRETLVQKKAQAGSLRDSDSDEVHRLRLHREQMS